MPVVVNEEKPAHDAFVRSLPPILPVGTQVVLHAGGGVGVVTAAPADLFHAYRIRLVDGRELSATRERFAVLSETQKMLARPRFPRETASGSEEIHAPERDRAWTPVSGHANRASEPALYETVIHRCVVGSRAFGLDDEESDFDRRGIYLPPASRHWSLAGVPEQLENPGTEEVYWELRKFLTLALKANPNVLECLYTDLIEHVDPLAAELLHERRRFLSRMAYQTFNGYALSQFKKLQADLRQHGEPKWKHVMHLIRLLASGVGVLRDGVVTVRVEETMRETLLAIKRGERTLAEIEALRLRLHTEFDDALRRTTLPERPDYAWADDFLIRARRTRVG